MSHWSDNYNVGGSLCNDNDFDDEHTEKRGKVYLGSFMWYYKVHKSSEIEYSKPIGLLEDEEF